MSARDDRAARLAAPIVEYVSRPKPFTPKEHRTRRKEELRVGIENMKAERLALTNRIDVAIEELKRLEEAK